MDQNYGKRAQAVNAMLRNLPERVRNGIWKIKNKSLNSDFLDDPGYLSGGERILFDAALHIWSRGLAQVDLEGVIGNLDDRNFDAFMDAVLIARGRKSETDEPSRHWYSRLALASTLQPDLNANEHAVLISCAASSEGNGHDFGILEQITGGSEGDWEAGFKPHGLTVPQIKGYLSQLQGKGYISIWEPEKVNGQYWVTRFELTKRGRAVFRLEV